MSHLLLREWFYLMSFIHDKYINDFTPSREIKEGVLRWLWKSEIWNPVLDKNKKKKHEKGLQRIQNGNQVLNLRETLWTKKTREDVSNDVKKVWVFREGRVCDL